MPTVLRAGPYRFFFYAEEGLEPPHIHIEAAEKRAKVLAHSHHRNMERWFQVWREKNPQANSRR